MRVDPPSTKQVVERFLAALNTGDLQGLMDVLAPDVVAVADGGGQVRGAARRPIVGASKLAAYLHRRPGEVPGAAVGTPTWVNGAPGARVEVDGVLVGAVSLTVEDGRITRIYSIANPREARVARRPGGAQPLSRDGTVRRHAQRHERMVAAEFTRPEFTRRPGWRRR